MFNFDVLVNNKPVKRYYDRSGQIWIEGRKGTSFTLRVKNNSYGRILGIVSVDGLNVVDGKHEPPEDSRGYIINSYSNINIPGWKISQDEVREFYFTVNGEDSYVRKIGADEKNIGVIAAAVYNEKKPVLTYTYSTSSDPWRYAKSNGTAWPIYDSGSLTCDEPQTVYNCSVDMSAEPVNFSDSVNQENGYIRNIMSSIESEKVSVGSGDRREFRTHKADFDRDVLEGVVTIYYDTWEGLKRRGILRDDKEYREMPQPFPNGNWCPDI